MATGQEQIVSSAPHRTPSRPLWAIVAIPALLSAQERQLHTKPGLLRRRLRQILAIVVASAGMPHVPGSNASLHQHIVI